MNHCRRAGISPGPSVYPKEESMPAPLAAKKGTVRCLKRYECFPRAFHEEAKQKFFSDKIVFHLIKD